MTLQRMRPGIDLTDAVPMFPRGRRPQPLAWLVNAFAAVPALLAVVSEPVGSRVILGALAVTVLAVGVSLLVMFGAVGPGVITVDAASEGLRFAPPSAASVPMFAIATALLLPAGARLVVDFAGLPDTSMSVLFAVGPYVLGVLGLGVLIAQVGRLRVPSGLQVGPRGLSGIRGAARVDWSWTELAQVAVTAGPAAKLLLVPAGGRRPVQAPALVLGSDPNVVAAIVRFYLEHPSERQVLAGDAEAAVRRFEQARAR